MGLQSPTHKVGNWIPLQPNKEKSFCYLITTDTAWLKPNQEMEVTVRVRRHTPSEKLRELFAEARAL